MRAVGQWCVLALLLVVLVPQESSSDALFLATALGLAIAAPGLAVFGGSAALLGAAGVATAAGGAAALGGAGLALGAAKGAGLAIGAAKGAGFVIGAAGSSRSRSHGSYGSRQSRSYRRYRRSPMVDQIQEEQFPAQDSYDNTVGLLVMTAGVLDQESSCAKRLVCELSAFRENGITLAEDEMALMGLLDAHNPLQTRQPNEADDLTADPIKAAFEPYLEAGELGRRVTSALACAQTFPKCGYSAIEIMSALRRHDGNDIQ
ncbi:hypothetical protein Pmani_035241 [Petrolisthes manimaculis]|uniref:Uncharacterized protein n=1 Tax=Petrolisthes manimaculis TaxID=1843537 RepID=A0AAE1NN96_9EUCA|nr:hypothetical protein Pmani_035241 [Petrolisthes manimaculis]